MDIVKTQRNIVRRNSFSNSPEQTRRRTVRMHDNHDGKTTSSDRPSTLPRGGSNQISTRSSVHKPTTYSSTMRRSFSEPPAARSMIEDYYVVEGKKRPVVLPGAPRYGDDWSRDVHDFFNLIVLVPIIVLNIMNWNWDLMLNLPPNKNMADAWTGDWFTLFFQTTTMYFLIDLLWVLLVPKCVKSPSTIIQHHCATLIYLYVPYKLSQMQWCMGACMSVEVNTWFLIARRVFNKQGFSPWVIDLPPLVSIRIKLTSIFFYTTWISIRCILYPYLFFVFRQLYISHTRQVGSKWNLMLLVVPLHFVFCLLNFKWSFDLLMSKIRYWRRLRKGGKGKKFKDEVSKGL